MRRIANPKTDGFDSLHCLHNKIEESFMSKSAIIGDIHGCSDALKRLLNELPDDIEQIYSVGDLVDRGADSKGVVQLCIDNNIKAVRGNHEDMFLDFLGDTKEYDEGHYPSEKNGGNATLDSYDNGLFEENGGDKTISSYGGDSYRVRGMYGTDYVSSVTIPEEHRIYLNSLPLFIETDDFILSHAGIHPMRATGEFGVGKWDDGSDKSNMDLMWNRCSLAVMDKIQIVGHNPVKEVEFVEGSDEDLRPVEGKIAGINIDTMSGKVNYGKLTALIMPTQEIVQVISQLK